MSPVSNSWDKSLKETVPSFALESASELSKLRTFDAPKEIFFSENTPPKTDGKASASDGGPKHRIVFMRGESSPSTLIEESLLRHHYDVTACANPGQLTAAINKEPFDLLLMDHAADIMTRQAIVRQVKETHPALPILLIFPPLSEDDIEAVVSEGLAEVVTRDMDGAYLLRIPDKIGQLVAKRKTTRKALSPTTKTPADDEITEQVDLQEVANGLLGAISNTQKASLTVLAGPDAGKVSHLGENAFIIGRDPTCQLQLKDESISRYHARITKNQHNKLTIEDLDSTNGTFIDGERIEKQDLEEGDKILLGQDTLIKYQKQDSIDKSYYDELYYSSTRDGLTGLYNRRFCLEKIGTDLSYSRRHILPVSLMIFDIDLFKNVNDTYGHPTGDTVLTTIAQLTAETCRTEDILGRYGGEEFIIFAMGTDNLGAQIFAERIRDKIEHKQIMAIDGSRRLFNTTVSIGIATTRAKVCYTFEKLMTEADANLYKAKETGRNRVVASEIFE